MCTCNIVPLLGIVKDAAEIYSFTAMLDDTKSVGVCWSGAGVGEEMDRWPLIQATAYAFEGVGPVSSPPLEIIVMKLTCSDDGRAMALMHLSSSLIDARDFTYLVSIRLLVYTSCSVRIGPRYC